MFNKKLLLLLTLNLSLVFTLKTKETTEFEIESELDSAFRIESLKMESLFDVYNFLPATNNTKTSNKNYITDLKNPSLDFTGWFGISNSKFLDSSKFSALKSDSKVLVDYSKLGSDNFIINKLYPLKAEPKMKNKFMFFLRFKNGLIYYTNAKDSMMVLGVFKPQTVQDADMSYDQINVEKTCITVNDEEEMTWKICAGDMELKKSWLCSLKDFLGNMKEEYCAPPELEKNANKTNSIKTTPKRVKNLIIIPTETRKCNNNWNYKKNGKDWECQCREGRSQSPIDLPNKEDAKISKVKPYFLYDKVSPIAKETSIDGLLREGEPIKIYHKSNAIRIFHNYLGKIIDGEGGVFHGEEIVVHTPSEHTIQGKKFDLEIQIIHYGKSKGDIAKQIVVSFLFYQKPGVFNKFFDKIDIYNIPNEMDTFRDLKDIIYIPNIFHTIDEKDATHMKDFSFYNYQGSLTSPPCTERTNHYVAATPLPISNTIISLFRESLKMPDYALPSGQIITSQDNPKLNDRKTQPLNGRTVMYYESEFGA